MGLVAYAALTIVLWFIMAPSYEGIGYIDKAIGSLDRAAPRRRLHGVLRAFWRDLQYAHDGTVMVGVSQQAVYQALPRRQGNSLGHKPPFTRGTI